MLQKVASVWYIDCCSASSRYSSTAQTTRLIQTLAQVSYYSIIDRESDLSSRRQQKTLTRKKRPFSDVEPSKKDRDLCMAAFHTNDSQ